MFPNRHPSGILKSVTLEARCKVTTESCVQPSNHMTGFITAGNPLNIKYWINIQQLHWCFLHFGRKLSSLCRRLTEWATTHFQEKSQNGGRRLHCAGLPTCSQREQSNRTTGWEMRLLLLFSLHETSLQLFLYLHGWPRLVFKLPPTQTYPLTLALVHSSPCILLRTAVPLGLGLIFLCASWTVFSLSTIT